MSVVALDLALALEALEEATLGLGADAVVGAVGAALGLRLGAEAVGAVGAVGAALGLNLEGSFNGKAT